MPAPLHPLPKHPEKWLPKFNPDYGLLVEEILHNYMLAINLNDVDEEDVVVRLFLHLLQDQQGLGTFHYQPILLLVGMFFKNKFSLNLVMIAQPHLLSMTFPI